MIEQKLSSNLKLRTDIHLTSKPEVRCSNSNVQRYIYTAKEINRQMDEVDGAIAPTTAIQDK
ncbi:hypothetical protein QUA35_05310 [Microcoleus sp. N9_B2]|uniref:hypothetical protein n=1 Tax=unclassified Microcoleus TaxID=2642155 RepID=UPI002FD4DE88